MINAWICTNWEIEDSGGPTYRLERAKSFYPQPERVRIKEFSAVEKPSVPSCQECLAAPQTPEWDGSLPDKSPIGETSLSWESAAVPLSISGLQLDYARLRFSAVGGPGSGGWELLIFCNQSGGGSSLLWRGIKTTGTDPIGGYQNSNPCPGQPCCFTVESY